MKLARWRRSLARRRSRLRPAARSRRTRPATAPRPHDARAAAHARHDADRGPAHSGGHGLEDRRPAPTMAPAKSPDVVAEAGRALASDRDAEFRRDRTGRLGGRAVPDLPQLRRPALRAEVQAALPEPRVRLLHELLGLLLVSRPSGRISSSGRARRRARRGPRAPCARGVRGERLLQKVAPSRAPRRKPASRRCIPRRRGRGCRAARLEQPARELRPGRARHDDVGQQKVEPAGVPRERPRGPPRRWRPAAPCSPAARGSGASGRARPPRPRRGGSSPSRAGCRGHASDGGRLDAGSRRAADRSRRSSRARARSRRRSGRRSGCTMPYTVARPSPVPCGFSLVVKKGSKIRFWVSGSMPTPVSTDREHDVAAGRRPEVEAGVGGVDLGVLGADRQRAALGHGVPRVDDEVDDDLLDLSRVGADAAERRVELGHEADVLADQPREHARGFRDERVDVEHASARRAACVKRRAAAGSGSTRARRPSGSPRSPRESARGARAG